MSSSPAFAWTPTVDDYERALRLWRAGSGAAARTRMIGATLMALGFITTYFSLTVIRSVPLSVIPLVFVLGIGLVWFLDLPARIGIRQAVRSTPAMLQPLRVEVGTKGLTASNPSGSETFPWSGFAAYIESDELMLVGLSLDSPAAIGILPRDATTNGAAWDTATARVRANVPLHPRLAHLHERKAR